MSLLLPESRSEIKLFHDLVLANEINFFFSASKRLKSILLATHGDTRQRNFALLARATVFLILADHHGLQSSFTWLFREANLKKILLADITD